MMCPDAQKLGILAGGGKLPRLLKETCQKQGRSVFVIAFKDQCEEATVLDVDHAWVRLGQAGKALDHLRENGVHQLVMAGHIKKPKLTQLMPDGKTLKFLAGGVLNKGDDGLLATIVTYLEKDEGFTLIGAHDVMPELLTPKGVLGGINPNSSDNAAIDMAVKAALELGARDIGQGAVADATHIIAQEDRSGTDAMLQTLRGGDQAHGAVLAKMCKPAQEKRADLPTIGLATIEHARLAGLRGIVIEAGASLIIDRANAIKAADKAGLFLVGR